MTHLQHCFYLIAKVSNNRIIWKCQKVSIYYMLWCFISLFFKSLNVYTYSHIRCYYQQLMRMQLKEKCSLNRIFTGCHVKYCKTRSSVVNFFRMTWFSGKFLHILLEIWVLRGSEPRIEGILEKNTKCYDHVFEKFPFKNHSTHSHK